jgi:hypothetical protein
MLPLPKEALQEEIAVGKPQLRVIRRAASCAEEDLSPL